MGFFLTLLSFLLIYYVNHFPCKWIDNFKTRISKLEFQIVTFSSILKKTDRVQQDHGVTFFKFLFYVHPRLVILLSYIPLKV